MLRMKMLLLVCLSISIGVTENAVAGLNDAQLVNSFAIPDNGEVHTQDGLAWDGNNLWVVSHTDIQHHYLLRLTTDGAVIEQFPTNSLFYSGTVTDLAYRSGVGLLAKIRKRIYTVDNNANLLGELSSSTAHSSIAYDEINNTIISLMPYQNGILVIFKDADMIPHSEWNNQWYYVNMNAIIPTGQAAELLGGAMYADGYLYVAHKNLYKVDVTNINQPVIVEEMPMPEDIVPAGIAAVDNTLLYVGIRDMSNNEYN